MTFFLIRVAPGGPFDQERQVPEEILKNLNAKYHLDEPLVMQYLRYMGDLIQGDLGPLFVYASRTVNEIIAETFPVSALIGFVGLIYALIIGSAFGVIAASKPNSLRDYLPMTFSMLGICLPSNNRASVGIGVFHRKGWFNGKGLTSAKDIILPVVTLGTIYAAYFSRLARGGILDMVRQDFIRTAKAKGLPGWLYYDSSHLKRWNASFYQLHGPSRNSYAVRLSSR